MTAGRFTVLHDKIGVETDNIVAHRGNVNELTCGKAAAADVYKGVVRTAELQKLCNESPKGIAMKGITMYHL